MKKILIILFALISTLGVIQAQDFHLSQYNSAPLYMNPALSGMYFGEKMDYRITSDYRSQWRSFGIKPFSTFYLGYDMPLKEQFGVGGYLISNRNGNGGMNSIQFMPSGAYRITKDKDGEHQLTAGVQMGIIYNSYDPDRYTYETQFTPDGPTVFDQNISSGENFVKVSLVRFEANMGAFYKFKKADWKAHPFFGYSVYNLTRPNQSFSGFGKDKLPMRWVYNLGADYKINEQVNLKPAILLMHQAKANELMIGATGSYLLKDTKYTILGGLNYRNKDAFIITLGMKYDRHEIAFSYDLNTSSLNDYTRGRGAFEFSLKLSGLKGTPMFNPKFR